jgi:hypothetical protein
MSQTNEFTKAFKDLMGSTPFDAAAGPDAMKAQLAIGEKLARVALDSAARSSDITTKWSNETIGMIREAAKSHADPADQVKALNGIAEQYVKVTSEAVAAIADTMTKAQIAALELLMAAGQEAAAQQSSAKKN